LNLPALGLPGFFRRRTTEDPRELRIMAKASTQTLRYSAEGDHEGARCVTLPPVPDHATRGVGDAATR